MQTHTKTQPKIMLLGLPMTRRGPQRTETISDPVLRRIFEVMPRWRGVADLCRDVPANLSNFGRQRRKGNPIPRKIIRVVCELSGARREYLLQGELPMYEAAGQRISALSEPLQRIIQLIGPLPLADQQVVAASAELVALRQTTDITTLAAIVKSLTNMSQLAIENTAIDPTDPLRRPRQSTSALKSR